MFNLELVLFHISKMFRLLDSSQHSVSVLEVNKLVFKPAVDDPVDTEILDKNLADLPQEIFKGCLLFSVSPMNQEQIAETVNTSDPVSWSNCKNHKLIKSDRTLLMNKLDQIGSGKLTWSKGSNGFAKINHNIFSWLDFSWGLLLVNCLPLLHCVLLLLSLGRACCCRFFSDLMLLKRLRRQWELFKASFSASLNLQF